jgi:hypothetical protein
MFNRKITISTQLIPTIVNGVTSCTAVSVAATGLLFTVALANKLMTFPKNKMRLFFSILLMIFSVVFVSQAFENLIEEHYEYAIRNSLTGMFVSVFLLLSNVIYFALRLLDN